MTDSIRKNKNQHNDAIENNLKFDNIFILSRGTKDPLLLVTVCLRVGKKHIATVVASIICLWDSGATDNIIKRKHTK